MNFEFSIFPLDSVILEPYEQMCPLEQLLLRMPETWKSATSSYFILTENNIGKNIEEKLKQFCIQFKFPEDGGVK